MRACLPLTCCVMKAAEKKKTRPASSLLTHSHARCSLPGPLCTLSYSVRQRASLRGLRCGSSWVNPNTNAAAIEPPNRGGTREPNLQRYIEVFPQLSTKAGGWGAQPPLPDAPKPHRSCNLRANQIEEKKGFPRVIPPPAPSHSFVWLLLWGEKKKKKNTAAGFGLLSIPSYDDLIIAGFVELPWATLASLDEWQLAVCADDPAFDRNMPFSHPARNPEDTTQCCRGRCPECQSWDSGDQTMMSEPCHFALRSPVMYIISRGLIRKLISKYLQQNIA